VSEVAERWLARKSRLGRIGLTVGGCAPTSRFPAVAASCATAGSPRIPGPRGRRRPALQNADGRGATNKLLLAEPTTPRSSGGKSQSGRRNVGRRSMLPWWRALGRLQSLFRPSSASSSNMCWPWRCRVLRRPAAPWVGHSANSSSVPEQEVGRDRPSCCHALAPASICAQYLGKVPGFPQAVRCHAHASAAGGGDRGQFLL
jgi:hypothetical protein